MLYCVVFLVLRQGSGANVCMRTPWPHQLIKAHDSPPGCDKAALNGQVVRWILWRASCIRSNIWPFSGAWMPVGMEVCSRVTGTICRSAEWCASDSAKMGQVWEFEWFGISVFLTGEVEQSIKECLHLGGCRGLPGKCLLDPNPGRMWGSNLGTTAAQRLNSKALVRRCLHPYPSLRHNP